MRKEDVKDRFESAQKRLDDIVLLNGGNLAGANAAERQRLVQEFFFHLIGGVDVLAQFVNDTRTLARTPKCLRSCCRESASWKRPASSQTERGYVRTRKAQVPTDLYTDEAYLFRAYNYRHQVTHRGANPFLFRLGSSPPARFLIDPRDTKRGILAKRCKRKWRAC